MSRQDVEHFQSFCRKWINRTVREHFRDLPPGTDGSLDTDSPRSVIRDVCLHKDTDTMTLTIGRMLIWWVEARGLFEDVIYGIPADSFHETVVYKPQIKLFWREKTEDARVKDRYPLRAVYSVRWKGDYASRNDLELLKTKLVRIFNSPVTHNFWKGREKFSYRDKLKGYEFIVTARDLTEAKTVINALLEIQNDNPLDESLLTRSTKDKNWNEINTVRVAGEIFKKPKERPIGRVYFTHAEFHVHGMPKPKTLVSNLPYRVATKLV